MKKNDREKQLLYEWGTKNCDKNSFRQINQAEESYFEQRSANLYLKEYSFDTLSEFMEEIAALWENDEKMEKIKKVVGVAAMKNKPVKTGNEKQPIKIQGNKEEKLPEFIYNF